MKQLIQTQSAPRAIGCYSQAIKAGNTVYCSGQIAMDPKTGELIEGDFEAQLKKVFENLFAVSQAAGGSLANVVKLTVLLVDMADYDMVNEVMKHYFTEPYPARAAFAVSALPKGARVEVDAVMVLGE